MRTVGWSRGALIAHLERLERRTVPKKRIKLRFGHLRRLPESYRGERHVVVAKQLPPQLDQEWVAHEEVPGPDPNPPVPHHHRSPEIIDVIFVSPFQPEGSTKI
jgi:hypothetical protein